MSYVMGAAPPSQGYSPMSMPPPHTEQELAEREARAEALVRESQRATTEAQSALTDFWHAIREVRRALGDNPQTWDDLLNPEAARK